MSWWGGFVRGLDYIKEPDDSDESALFQRTGFGQSRIEYLDLDCRLDDNEPVRL